MTDAEYADILRTHGRRVANRVVLSATPLDQRLLSDFYDCHAPEAELPEHERGSTPLVSTFDPTGWNALYSSKTYGSWPDPEPPEVDGDDPPPDESAAAKEERLRADIVAAGRAVWDAVATISSDEEQTRRGGVLINEHCERLAAKYQIAADAKLHDAIVDSANACLIEQEQE